MPCSRSLRCRRGAKTICPSSITTSARDAAEGKGPPATPSTMISRATTATSRASGTCHPTTSTFLASRREFGWGPGPPPSDLWGRSTKKNTGGIFRGFHPFTGEPLVQNAGKADRRPGWEGCESVQKDLSILTFGGPPEWREELLKACREVCEDAVRMLEERFAFSRAGKAKDGCRYVRVGLVVAMWEHASSRALDEDLHYHLQIFNLGVDDTTHVRAIDSRPLFINQKIITAYINAKLAEVLTSRFGLTIEVHGSSFRIRGVPEELVKAKSKRRQQILDWLAERGESGSEAADRAALETRPRKDTHISRAELIKRWRAENAAAGFDDAYIRNLLRHAHVKPNATADRVPQSQPQDSPGRQPPAAIVPDAVPSVSPENLPNDTPLAHVLPVTPIPEAFPPGHEAHASPASDTAPANPLPVAANPEALPPECEAHALPAPDTAPANPLPVAANPEALPPEQATHASPAPATPQANGSATDMDPLPPQPDAPPQLNATYSALPAYDPLDDSQASDADSFASPWDDPSPNPPGHSPAAFHDPVDVDPATSPIFTVRPSPTPARKSPRPSRGPVRKLIRKAIQKALRRRNHFSYFHLLLYTLYRLAAKGLDPGPVFEEVANHLARDPDIVPLGNVGHWPHFTTKQILNDESRILAAVKRLSELPGQKSRRRNSSKSSRNVPP